MRYTLSTLLLVITCIAVSIGWLSERRFYQSALEEQAAVIHHRESSIASAEGLNKFENELARHEAGVTNEEGFARVRARSLYENVLKLYFNESRFEPRENPLFTGPSSVAKQQNRVLETAGHSLHLLGVTNSSELHDVTKNDPHLLGNWTFPVQSDGSIEPAFLTFVDQSIFQYIAEHGTQEQRWTQELTPMIELVDNFIDENSRFPNSTEFDELNKMIGGHGLTLKYETEYVKGMGGTGKTDYILGVWVSEWHYCYRSWDQGFHHDRNGALFGH